MRVWCWLAFNGRLALTGVRATGPHKVNDNAFTIGLHFRVIRRTVLIEYMHICLSTVARKHIRCQSIT